MAGKPHGPESYMLGLGQAHSSPLKRTLHWACECEVPNVAHASLPLSNWKGSSATSSWRGQRSYCFLHLRNIAGNLSLYASILAWDKIWKGPKNLRRTGIRLELEVNPLTNREVVFSTSLIISMFLHSSLRRRKVWLDQRLHGMELYMQNIINT